MSVRNRPCLVLLVLSSATVMASTDEILKARQGEEVSRLAYCVVEIIRSMDVEKLSVFGDAESSVLIADIFNLVDVPVLMNSKEVPKKEGMDTRIPNDLVIIVNETSEMASVLNDVLWNAETRFILVFETQFDGGVFQRFWEERVVNVFAVVEEKEGTFLYGFLPYGTGYCGLANPILLDKCSDGRFSGKGISAIKKDVKVKDMKKCPVNVTIVDVQPQVIFHDDCSCNKSDSINGIEGKIMMELANEFNMRAEYVIALDGIGWGWIKPDPHGVVGEVFTGRSDFGLGLLAPTIERYENLDLSVHYNGPECITYGVPKGAGQRQPTWITILVFEFQGIMWLLIALVFVVILICFWLINKALKLSLFPDKFDVFMYLLGSCLGTPIKIQSSLTLKLAVISWIIFTFITTVAYKSSMGSKLTVPTPDPDINTFKELLRSNLILTGYNNMLRLMQYNGSDEDIERMADRFVVTNFKIDVAVDMIARHRKIAHVRHKTTFLYYSLIDAEARGHVHVLHDCIYRYYPMFVMKKNSPFTKRANEIILRLNEGGFVKHWTSNYIYHLPNMPKTFEKLSLDHTFGMFFIIFLGYSSASVVFVAEILYHNFFVRRRAFVKKSTRVRGVSTLFKRIQKMKLLKN